MASTTATLIYGLKKADVQVDRKVLADIAANDAEGFSALAELAKSQRELINCACRFTD